MGCESLIASPVLESKIRIFEFALSPKIVPRATVRKFQKMSFSRGSPLPLTMTQTFADSVQRG